MRTNPYRKPFPQIERQKEPKPTTQKKQRDKETSMEPKKPTQFRNKYPQKKTSLKINQSIQKRKPIIQNTNPNPKHPKSHNSLYIKRKQQKKTKNKKFKPIKKEIDNNRITQHDTDRRCPQPENPRHPLKTAKTCHAGPCPELWAHPIQPAGSTEKPSQGSASPETQKPPQAEAITWWPTPPPEFRRPTPAFLASAVCFSLPNSLPLPPPLSLQVI